MEDYLEAIATLKKRDGVARVRDISRLLGVEPPSVASALRNLSKGGFVVHERYGYVELTPEGEKLAEKVENKHKVLLEFLTEILNIKPKVAQEDACGMEHSVSPETLKKITKFIDFVKGCPQDDKPDWLKSFEHYFRTGKRRRCKIKQMKQKMKVEK
jgi:DtxR family Mn-dependent transcriptional regulator